MVIYLTLGYIGVLLTGVAQICLKKGSNIQSSSLSIYINAYTLGGYALMFCVTLINLYIYRYLDIKYGVILLPFTFIVVNILSFLLLKERLGKTQLVGSSVILFGVVVFNM